jgi:methionyl-tRNA formyltransferase
MSKNLENKNFKIVILNQQKNKTYLKKLIQIIRLESKFNKVEVLKKINFQKITKKKIDFLISFHNSEIIDEKTIKSIQNNCINFHSSVLPKNRGGSPILWSAINKDKFGITIHKLAGGLDRGTICAQKIIHKIKKNSTLETMYHLLESEGLKLFKNLLPKFKKEIQTKKRIINYKLQDENKKSYNSLKKSKEMMNFLPNKYNTKIKDIKNIIKKKELFQNFKFKTYSLSKNIHFLKLQDLILKKILNKKSYTIKELKLNRSHIIDLRNNNNLMIKIESLLKKILKRIGFNNISSMQYPVNIRIVNSNFDDSNKKDYDTRFLHCDSWSGAPEDSLNGFIYLYYEKNSPIVKIYDTIPKNNILKFYKGKYKDAKISKSLTKEKKFSPKIGNMALWPTHTIHKTSFKNNKNSKEKWRISLDFRIKGSNPYNLISKNNLKKFYETKMNSDGVYWHLSNSKDIKAKIINELKKSRLQSKSAYIVRKRYINKYYKKYSNNK